MTATFFYSEKQKQIVKKRKHFVCTINGKEYTQLSTLNNPLEHKSNFDDAIIVYVAENLPAGKGEYFNYADTSELEKKYYAYDHVL